MASFFLVATCVCPDTFVGDDCHSHQCTGSDGVTLACQNGGTCLEGVGTVTTNQFYQTRCECVPPYGGAECDVIDACAGQHCSFRGDCRYNDDGSAHCECDASRWTGDSCEVEDCGTNTCYNGGSCTL